MAALTHTKGSIAGEHDKGSAAPHRRSRVFFALVLLSACAFVMFSLVSYDPRDPCFNTATQREDVSNLCGLFGSYLADGLVQLLGWASIMVPVGLFLAALRLMRGPGLFLRAPEIGMYCLLLSGVAIALERVFRLFPQGMGSSQPGGALGSFLHGLLERYVGAAGELVLVCTVVVLCAFYFSNAALHDYWGRVLSGRCWMAGIGACLRLLARGVGFIKTSLCQGLFTRGRQSVAGSRPQGVEAAAAVCPAPSEIVIHGAAGNHDIGIHELERVSCLPKGDIPGVDCDAVGADVKRRGTSFHERQQRFLDRIKAFPWKPLEQPREQEAHTQPAQEEQKALGGVCERAADVEASTPFDESLSCCQSQDEPDTRAVGGIRVSERADASLHKTALEQISAPERDDYIYPPLDLLDEPQISGRSVDKALLETNAHILTQKLAELGIQGQVVEIHPGPVITMYELALAPGIPLRKVLSTADDLAMALKSGSTRVVAPIPGKDTVGIEVPNLYREIVYFREIIESEVFAKSKEPLKVALGKGIDGEPFATSLTKMPHLLIAGATGTGKSVGLNCLICSWLMCCHPDDVKFLMVDPKKLELSYYQDIPHLIHPVVTDAEKVPRVLSWAIREMERRYDLLSKAGAKNIEGYNLKVSSGEITAEDGEKSPEKLPYIVIIVDELAELMMVAAKDIEISIARLAQMARASGIHLILATQRPSVDVITGVIKANFPARISFQVSAKPDSRTILDTTGAENLLGMGDMLFLPPGTAKLRRLHGAYVSENEIRRIADFIKAQRSPVYLQEITRHVSEEDKGNQTLDLMADEKYDEAVELVTRLGHASISLIQRHMRIGYNRAARIIEMMESEGIIGPSDGTSRPREVLVGSLAHIPDGEDRPYAGV